MKVYFKDKQALDIISEKLNFLLRKEFKYFNAVNKKIKINNSKHKEKEIFNEDFWVKTKMPLYTWGNEKDYYCKIDMVFGKDDNLSDIFEQNVSKDTQFLHFPKKDGASFGTIIKSNKKNKYPIYIPSKGRWDSCKTAEFFTAINADFYIIVEEQEYELYNKFYPKSRLLILPKKFQDEYNTLDKEKKSVGPGAARNFAWEDSIKKEFKFHWVFDDNVPKFYVYNNNNYFIIADTGAFTIAERYLESYDNIGICSINYEKFVIRKTKNPPYIKNTRMYSMMLIKNSLPYRWRGRYNEDTILSLDLLTNSISTLQLSFIQGTKMTTQTLKGGNSEEFYFKEGTLPKSMMLANEYPGLTELTYKFGRWHHFVSYKNFKFNPGNKTEEFYKDYNLTFTTEKISNKTLKVSELAKYTNSKDFNLLENVEHRVTKRLVRNTNENYNKGYFIREKQGKIMILGNIINPNTNLDIINVVTQEKSGVLAKYCFNNQINMYDVNSIEEGIKLLSGKEQIEVYDDIRLFESINYNNKVFKINKVKGIEEW